LELPFWTDPFWILVAAFGIVAVVAIGHWLLTGWMTNVLRNHLDAKRRLRRRSP